MPLDETRRLLAMTDDELEELIKKWIARLVATADEYVGFDRPTASADQGRDAVGFLTARRYDDAWDNYQCKHLKRPLGLSAFLIELGKMFFHADQGHFVLPRRYVFVVPNSAVSDVLKLIDRPLRIGPALIEMWDTHCRTGITNAGAELTDTIRAEIESYAFENVLLWKSTDIVEQSQMRGLMVELFGDDPGAAPTVTDEQVPAAPGSEEANYLAQIRRVYGEHKGEPFPDHDALVADPEYGPRITRTRRQFLERKAFRLHFRDNLDAALLDQVDTDVLDGVQDHYDSHEGGSRYDRLLGVMEKAATMDVSGPLGKHRRVTPRVKQGVCHHHAGEGEMPLRWDR